MASSVELQIKIGTTFAGTGAEQANASLKVMGKQFTETSAEIKRALGRINMGGMVGEQAAQARAQLATVRGEMSKFGEELRKKMGGAQIGKSVLEGLGIGTGFQAAHTLAGMITNYYKQAAEHAQRIEEATARSFKFTKDMIALRNRNDVEAQRKALQSEYDSAKKNFEAANAPQYRTISQTDEDGRVISRETVLVERTKEQSEVLEDLKKNLEDADAALRKFKATQEDKDESTDKSLMSSAIDRHMASVLGIARANGENEQKARAAEAALKAQGEAMTATVDPAKALELKLREINTLEEKGAITADVAAKARAAARASIERENDALKINVELRQQQINQRLAALDADYAHTDAEKWGSRRKLMEQAVENARAYLKAMQDLRAKATTDDARRQGDANVMQAQGNLAGAQRDLAGIGADPNSFHQSLVSQMQQLREQWGTMAQNMASVFSSTMQAAVNSISNGITGLIMRTRTWRQALTDIATTILTTIVSSIVQMAVRWVATQVMMAVMGKAITAAAVATMIPLALASSSIWAAPATLATIATMGGAAAQAPLSIATAQGSVLLQSLAAFEKGGIIKGGEQIIRVNEAGTEAVLNADATRRLGQDFINAANAGDFSSMAASIPEEIAYRMPTPDVSGVLARQASPQAPAAPANSDTNFKFLILPRDNVSDALTALKSEAGRRYVIDLIRRNVTRG